jgi:hypothetical protein
MEKAINILQKGNIYFFYRPKINQSSQKEEIQRFFLVLHPENQNKYHLLVVGKKHLPTSSEGSYFLFVEAIKKAENELLQDLREKHYMTKTRGERTLPFSHCLAEGKYLLATHENHTHFIYQLVKPHQIKKTQEEFHLQPEADYLISVKNPQISPSPGTGLSENQQATYPPFLQKKFGGYHFISLNPVDFLDYPGAELLLIPKKKEILTKKEKEVATCLAEIPEDNFLQEFAKITSPKAIAPIEE